MLAKSGAVVEARHQASAALLHGADNYLVLHNVACIYAELSQTEQERPSEFENLALAMLQREVSRWREVNSGPDALELI